MKPSLIAGALLAALFLAVPASAAELETEAQQLGYIIGMDIGKSLKQQGTELDLNALFEAIRATYNDEPLAMTPEEAATIRETFIAKRRAAAEQERQSAAAKNASKSGPRASPRSSSSGPSRPRNASSPSEHDSMRLK